VEASKPFREVRVLFELDDHFCEFQSGTHHDIGGRVACDDGRPAGFRAIASASLMRLFAAYCAAIRLARSPPLPAICLRPG
jgi:hypothetical protein